MKSMQIICIATILLVCLSLFLSGSDLFSLLIRGVGRYYRTWSHWVTRVHARTHTHTHTNSVGLVWTRDRPTLRKFTATVLIESDYWKRNK